MRFPKLRVLLGCAVACGLAASAAAQISGKLVLGAYKPEPPKAQRPGFNWELENGFKIYHMGDTALFGDMKFIADYYKPDLVMIPIGGHFTMGPRDAAHATREWLKPKYAIPIHYGTLPELTGTPKEYMQALGTAPTKVLPIAPGEKLAF